MSRFHWSLIGLVLSGITVGLLFQGASRLWLWAALAVVYLMVLAFGVFYIQAGFFLRSFCRGTTNEKITALTFDDGPDPDSTPAVLDVLAQTNSPAAFFCVGSRIEAYPELARRLDREGHIIGNHSHRHAWWTNFLWGNRLEKEIRSGQEAVASAIGKHPNFYRPPVALTNPHLPRVLKKLKLDCVGYEIRPYDRTSDTEAVLNRILPRLRPGAIILLHDAGQAPDSRTRLVRNLIQALDQKGYTIVRLDKLLGRPGYK